MIDGGTKKKLETFLRRQLFDKGNCLKLVIRHIDDFGKAKHEIDTVTVPRMATPEHLDDIIADLSRIIEFDAEEMDGGPPKYGIFACFEKAEDTARFLLRVRNARTEENDGLVENEPPNKNGLTAQAMRHSEGAVRTLVTGMQVAFKAQQEVIERQVTMIDALMSKHLAYITAIEEANDRKSEREVETIKAVSAAEQKERALEKFFLMGSVAVSRLKGKTSAKEIDKNETVTTGDILTLQFFESLTEEQRNNLLEKSDLTMEQKLTLAQLQQHMANKFAKDRNPAANGKSDPEKKG